MGNFAAISDSHDESNTEAMRCDIGLKKDLHAGVPVPRDKLYKTGDH